MSLTCLTNVVYLAWKTLMEMVHARVLLSSHTVPKHYFLSKNLESQKILHFWHQNSNSQFSNIKMKIKFSDQKFAFWFSVYAHASFKFFSRTPPPDLPPPTLGLPLQDFWENDDILKVPMVYTPWPCNVQAYHCQYSHGSHTHVYELIIESIKNLELFSLIVPHLWWFSLWCNDVWGIWLLSFNDVSSSNTVRQRTIFVW